MQVSGPFRESGLCLSARDDDYYVDDDGADVDAMAVVDVDADDDGDDGRG